MRKRSRVLFILSAVVFLFVMGTGVSFGVLTEVHTNGVSFASDLEASKYLYLPTFDTQGGARTLTGVTIEFTHSGAASIAADNDDAFQSSYVNGRVIRTWQANGPGLTEFATTTIQSSAVELFADDGDGGSTTTFDPTGPDGTAFVVSYSGYTGSLGPHNPATNLYQSNGASTVGILVTALTMVNDLQWTVQPDAFQSEVELPSLDVNATVTYNYIPEPATMLLLGLGGLFLRKRS